MPFDTNGHARTSCQCGAHSSSPQLFAPWNEDTSLIRTHFSGPRMPISEASTVFLLLWPALFQRWQLWPAGQQKVVLLEFCHNCSQGNTISSFISVANVAYHKMAFYQSHTQPVGDIWRRTCQVLLQRYWDRKGSLSLCLQKRWVRHLLHCGREAVLG